MIPYILVEETGERF